MDKHLSNRITNIYTIYAQSNIPSPITLSLYKFNSVIKNICIHTTYTKTLPNNIYFNGILKNKANIEIKCIFTTKNKNLDKYIEIIRFIRTFIVNKYTFHIVSPILFFYTSIYSYMKTDKHIISNVEYTKILNNFNEMLYNPKVGVVIFEKLTNQTLLSYLKINNLPIIYWKIILFQIISTLATIQSIFPTFRHNQLSCDNIMIYKTIDYELTSRYTIENINYSLPSIGYKILINNFDLVNIPGIIDNDDIYDDHPYILLHNNRYYDIHYFLDKLLKYNIKIPVEIMSFIDRILPIVYRGDRLMFNDEFIIPNDILLYDPLFYDFRNEYLRNVNIKIINLVCNIENYCNLYKFMDNDIYWCLWNYYKKDLRKLYYYYWCLGFLENKNKMMVMQFVIVLFIKNIKLL